MYLKFKYRSLVLLILITMLFSCKIKNNAGKQDFQNLKMDEQYIKDGFVKAYIVQIDNVDEPCDFLIKLENGNLLEPLNLSAGFKQNNISVWLKYNMQRRQSRCSNTQPVEIIDIKK